MSIVRLPKWLSGKESTCQCRRHRLDPWVRKIPWKRKWQPTPVFLLGKSHGQRSLIYGPWSPKRLGHGLGTKQQQVHSPIAIKQIKLSLQRKVSGESEEGRTGKKIRDKGRES